MEPGKEPLPDPTADHGDIATACFYSTTRMLAGVASVLGKDLDATRYHAQADRIRTAWQTEYLRPDGNTHQ